MTQTRRSGPATGRPDTTHLPLSVHEQCEWEGAHQYAEGWAAGYAAGQLAIANEVAAAIGVPAYDRVAVIRDLIRGIGQVKS